jgi:hypothetical protein
MPAMEDRRLETTTAASTTIIGWSSVPLHERVLDRLADVLFDTDEILAMLHPDDLAPTNHDRAKLTCVTSEIRQVYDTINSLMMRMSD